jgi:hypothetical protein
MTMRVGLMVTTACSASGVSLTPTPRWDSGCSAVIRAAKAWSSADACATVVPSASRARIV